MFASSWEAVASLIKGVFSTDNFQMSTVPQKVVATTVTLEDFKKAFLCTENFISLACWESVTHLVVRDFLNISTVGDEVCVAGLADRFGWSVYKSLLRRLIDAHPNITLLLEFHEIIDRDLLYGSRRFPCCDVEAFINENFPTGNVGICMRVMNYMSCMNLDSGLGTALKCLAANMGKRFSLWLDVENQYFSHNADFAKQLTFFDGVFMRRCPRLNPEQKKQVVVKIEKPFIDAKVAYLNYAGMMTCPIFQDGSDASILPFSKARLDMLANPSMFNTCLQEWHSLAQQNPYERCSKCALPNSVCAVQSDVPGSCSKQTDPIESTSNDSCLDDGMIFVLEN